MTNKEKYIETIQLLKAIFNKLRLSFYEMNNFKTVKNSDNISITMESFGASLTNMNINIKLGLDYCILLNFYLFDSSDILYLTKLYGTFSPPIKIDTEVLFQLDLDDFNLECFVLENNRLPDILLNLDDKEIIRELIS